MKTTRLSSQIKALGLFATSLCALGPALSGCAAEVAEAPFPSRPDTVEPGSLLGPFDGRVVEAATGKPIAGAIVYAAWGLESGRGLVAPAGGASATVETNADGHYVIPQLERLPATAGRLDRFTLIAYKPGFVVWRSDRRFEDGSERHDFAQTQNVAKLDKYPTGLSHARHLQFAGGSGALRRALEAAGEVVQASLERHQAQVATEAPPAGPPLDASLLLSDDELRAVTGFAGSFTVEKLTDLPSTPQYDSKHFRALDKAESFDAAYRVWKLPSSEAAEARFTKIAAEVPNATLGNEVGGKSLRAHDEKILAAAAVDDDNGLVIELTCGVDLCHDADKVSALLKRLMARGLRLGHEERPVEESK